nr:alpha-L-fucosidase [Clostridia bacterium]
MNFTPDTINMANERFGMFVHWGLYSLLGGIWKGEQVAGLGEWIMRRAEIPLAEYGRLANEFKPDPDYAIKLVRAAKNAGMKYIVLTTKHHDGFCLFKSDYSVYNAYHMCGRDLVRELVDACRAEDMKVGFYYSHTLDWAEKDGAGWTYATGIAANNDNYWDYPDRDEKDFARYFYGKAMPQIKELLTNYGDVFLLWCDYPHNITPKQADDLRMMVKYLQPHCVINSRIAHGRADYESLGDNAIPTIPLGIPSECLVTLNDTWGYKSYDHNWKSAEDMIGLLVRCISGGTTLLMNVGPYASGILTPETYEILETMGKWTKRYGEAVYNVSDNPFRAIYKWGYLSVANDKRKVYLYVTNDETKSISLAGLYGKVKNVKELGGTQQNYNRCDSCGKIDITLDRTETGLPVPVFCIEFDEEATFCDHIIQQGDTVYLNSFMGEKYVDGQPSEKVFEHNTYDPMFGKRGLAINKVALVMAWTKANEHLEWEAEFTEPGKYRCEATLDDTNYNAEVTAELANRTASATLVRENAAYSYNLSKTGHDNIRRVYNIGTFEIKEPGTYRIALKRKTDGTNIPLSDISFIKE